MAPIARYPILWEGFIGTGEDDYGNTVERWAPAVSRLIYGINFSESSESVTEGGHNRLVIDRVMLVPPSSVYGEKDRVSLPDEPGFKYEVVGMQAKADRNPFGWNPGGHVNIRRVDG